MHGPITPELEGSWRLSRLRLLNGIDMEQKGPKQFKLLAQDYTNNGNTMILFRIT